ncbi:hypothetical protein MNEG_7311, partial [Monoraphidium neglectum]
RAAARRQELGGGGESGGAAARSGEAADQKLGARGAQGPPFRRRRGQGAAPKLLERELRLELAFLAALEAGGELLDPSVHF